MRIGQGLGITLRHVPYRGAAPAMSDLMGGILSSVVMPISDTLKMHEAGKVRILATTGIVRSLLVDGVPTMKEVGVDMDISAWTGLYGPAGMPAAETERLQGAVRQVLQMPALQQRLTEIGMAAAPLTSAELAHLQSAELSLWAPTVKSSGFAPED
jgi:tripartite-type tricarboxylate transporter receptor subunit TctC